MNVRNFTPYATRSQTIRLSPSRVAEETGDYQQADQRFAATARKASARGAARRIELEAVRRTSDVQIGRLLRLANLLEELEVEDLASERGPVAEGIREAAAVLEQYLHKLSDAVEENTLA